MRSETLRSRRRQKTRPRGNRSGRTSNSLPWTPWGADSFAGFALDSCAQSRLFLARPAVARSPAACNTPCNLESNHPCHPPPNPSQIRVAQGNNRKSAPGSRPPAELLSHSRAAAHQIFRLLAFSFLPPSPPYQRNYLEEYRVGHGYQSRLLFRGFGLSASSRLRRKTRPSKRTSTPRSAPPLSPLRSPTVISLQHPSRPAQLFYWSAPAPLELAFFHHAFNLPKPPNTQYRPSPSPPTAGQRPFANSGSIDQSEQRIHSRDGSRPVERRVARGDAGTHPAGTSRG